MKKNLVATAPKPEQDPSDVLSTSTNNSGHHSPNPHSPSHLNLNSEEFETLCDGSRKIRKKRNAYQKIDDDIRLGLLEAVKQGETLKAAAKKFKINYSSAKSILHTYRKEGRILKKSAQERNVKRNPTGNDENEELDASPQNMSDNENIEPNNEFQTPFKGRGAQIEALKGQEVRLKGEAVNKGQEIVDSIMGMQKTNGNIRKGLENARNELPIPKALNKTSSRPGNIEEEQESQSVMGNSMLSELVSANIQNPATLMNLTQMLQGNSMDKFKMLDSVFANISSSPFPIMTKALKAYTDSSGSKTETGEKDGDSVSEEVNVAQNQPKQAEEICMPHPLRFNTAQLMQEKIESQLNSNSEGLDWDVTIENAAIDTFKSFMDAQLLLCDALKKASYLNSLLQAQKARKEANPVQDQL